jgi:hypothetical protein
MRGRASMMRVSYHRSRICVDCARASALYLCSGSVHSWWQTGFSDQTLEHVTKTHVCDMQLELDWQLFFDILWPASPLSPVTLAKMRNTWPLHPESPRSHGPATLLFPPASSM